MVDRLHPCPALSDESRVVSLATSDIQAAPHETDVLERYPQVGILKKDVVEQEIPAALAWLLKKFPMLRRHPHPKNRQPRPRTVRSLSCLS